MNRYFLMPALMLLFTSCKMLTSSEQKYAGSAGGKIYTLRVEPNTGVNYHYDIANKVMFGNLNFLQRKRCHFAGLFLGRQG